MHSWKRSCTGCTPRPGTDPGLRYSIHCTGQNSGHLPQGKHRLTSMNATSRGRFFLRPTSSGVSGMRSSLRRRLMISMALMEVSHTGALRAVKLEHRRCAIYFNARTFPSDEATYTEPDGPALTWTTVPRSRAAHSTFPPRSNITDDAATSIASKTVPVLSAPIARGNGTSDFDDHWTVPFESTA